MLAATLKSGLERRGEGARTLALSLFRVDGAVSRIAIGTSRPLRDPALIRRLFHEKLAAIGESLDAGYGFDLVRLSVLAATPFAARQADLAGAADEEEDGLALFADRVRARLGEGAVLRARAGRKPLPERSVALLPFARAVKEEPLGAAAPGRRRDRIRRSRRPVQVCRRSGRSAFSPPEPIEVPATEMTEGPPLRFRWRRRWHRVAMPRGRSASPRSGGWTRKARRRRPATITASRMSRGAATGSIARACTRPGSPRRAGSCTASSHECAVRPRFVGLCRIRRSVEFFSPARRFQS